MIHSWREALLCTTCIPSKHLKLLGCGVMSLWCRNLHFCSTGSIGWFLKPLSTLQHLQKWCGINCRVRSPASHKHLPACHTKGPLCTNRVPLNELCYSPLDSVLPHHFFLKISHLGSSQVVSICKAGRHYHYHHCSVWNIHWYTHPQLVQSPIPWYLHHCPAWTEHKFHVRLRSLYLCYPCLRGSLQVSNMYTVEQCTV